MWNDVIRKIIQDVKEDSLSIDEGIVKIHGMMSANIGIAEVDLGRSIRTGYPEVVFCLNKKDDDVLRIVEKIKEKNEIVLLTRAKGSTFELLKNHFKEIQFYERSGVITVGTQKEEVGLVTVISAGTSDIPIAEEASVTARVMGSRVQSFWDIGVAGIHRIFSKLDALKESRVIIAVAGMDGALPGVVAGLVGRPVIAVPTSIGYGTGTGGYAALLTMLNSCAPGVSVVNIDNGFGAGFIATQINKIGEK
jgi:NCAIR mutase (PurE)-related protein